MKLFLDDRIKQQILELVRTLLTSSVKQLACSDTARRIESVHAMAEMNDNLNVIIPISRYVGILVILSSLSMVEQCHGQWWFPTVNNTSTTGSSPPGWTGFPTTPAAGTPPSPATTSTTCTTLIVMPSTSNFGPQSFYTSVQSAIDAVPGNDSQFSCLFREVFDIVMSLWDPCPRNQSKVLMSIFNVGLQTTIQV
jgi:hypothetical protein